MSFWSEWLWPNSDMSKRMQAWSCIERSFRVLASLSTKSAFLCSPSISTFPSCSRIS